MKNRSTSYCVGTPKYWNAEWRDRTNKCYMLCPCSIALKKHYFIKQNCILFWWNVWISYSEPKELTATEIMKFNVFKRNLCELWISWKNCHKSCSYQEISVPKRTWDLHIESHLRLVIWRMKNGTKRKSEFRCPFIKFVLALYDFVLRILFKTKVMIIITFNALNIFILILLTWLAFWFFYILNSLFYDKVFKLLDLWIVS